MKQIITVAALLIIATGLMLTTLAARAVAATPDIDKWETLNWQCVYSVKMMAEEIQKACTDAEVLAKKLMARGFCMYGHGVIGIASKNRKHCYERKN
jgi:hypothetical protein